MMNDDNDENPTEGDYECRWCGRRKSECAALGRTCCMECEGHPAPKTAPTAEARGYMLPSQTDVWATPDYLFGPIEKEWGPFDLDPAANAENAKAPLFFTEEQSGLLEPWHQVAKKVYLNPPYSDIFPWVEKSYGEAKKGCLVVMLLPARTGPKWFHRFIWDGAAKKFRPGVEVQFLPGRVRYGDGTKPAPFDSMIVVFHPYLRDGG